MTQFFQKIFANRRDSFPAIFVKSVVVILAGLLVIVGESAYPQSDCFGQRDIVVSDLCGQVFDPSGEPISSVSIAVSQNEKPIATTTTNESGSFGIQISDGTFWIKASAQGFSSSSFRVRLHRAASGKPLRVILGVGIYTPCPSATLSDKEFKSLIRKYQDQIKADASKK
jgi:Carboxypeptidase regulatory-like domain